MSDFSFFFTNFQEYHVKDMWKIFRWGRVLDVLIPRNLNSRNKRFGFERFSWGEGRGYAGKRARLNLDWL